jgi:ankyrin repeat protein
MKRIYPAVLFILASIIIMPFQAYAGELHDAAKKGDIVKVRELLQQGADVNAKDNNQWTPLHVAAKYGKTKVAKLLIEQGADVNAKDKYQLTPLHVAAYYDQTEVAKLLIEKGADVNAKDNNQWTPLHQAASNGKTEVAKLLIEKGADVNARSGIQETPLHQAASNGKTEVAKLLIEKGADVNAKNKYQEAPLHRAAYYGQTEVAKLLIEKGADVNAKNRYQDAPLYWAASNGKTEVAKLLIEMGADVNAKDMDGRTALTIAEANHKTETADMLRTAMSSSGARPVASPQETLNGYIADLRDHLTKQSGVDVGGTWRFPGEKDFHFTFELRGNQLVATYVYDNEELARDYGKEMPFFTATLEGNKFSGKVSFYKFKNSPIVGTIDEAGQKMEWTISQRGIKETVVRQGGPVLAKKETTLRKRIIEFAATLEPPPAIPEEAQRAFVQGNTIMKAAKSAGDYNLAINKYREALNKAPWWGNAYYNLAMAENAAGLTDAAKADLELYTYTKPKDAAQAQNKIYEIEAQQELQEKHEGAMKAKYGGGRGSGFDWQSLFRYGAVVQSMSFDASGNERTISLKVVTRKEGGYLHNYFQIADITSGDDVFLQVFSMDWRGTNTFYLDDRTFPNKELMALTVTSYGDGDANITIRPAGNASASIKTTLAGLLRERAAQAVYAGDKITVGDRAFYTLGQGGAVGSLLFFPAEIKGMLENGSVYDLMPTFVANVCYRGSDGSTRNYANTDLGMVNGAAYHLEHNGGYWEAKPGRGENH